MDFDKESKSEKNEKNLLGGWGEGGLRGDFLSAAGRRRSDQKTTVSRYSLYILSYIKFQVPSS